jgi:hypothetical protein
MKTDSETNNNLDSEHESETEIGEKEIEFPINPLDSVIINEAIQRSTVRGILESYNSNYDVLGELVQNSMDAIEDAYLAELPTPYLLRVHINLKENWISVLDSGIGMSRNQTIEAFAPHNSFKNIANIVEKRGRNKYRGYKGVGLTFLAYGTDEITLHSKDKDGNLTKGRMQYGRKWAFGEIDDAALVTEDLDDSLLDNLNRGTYVKIQLSPKTRPKKLSSISANPQAWQVILRTRTAIGQISLNHKLLVENLKGELIVTDSEDAVHTYNISPTFYLPHLVKREPPFRFLDVAEYHKKNSETTEIPPESSRQDGIYLIWDKDKIFQELTAQQQKDFADEINEYNPILYGFLPYTPNVWNQINQELTGVNTRNYLSPGLIIGINKQRLADTFELEPTRYTNIAPYIFVLIHFDNAKPDQGRKTVQEEVILLAKRAADRVLQYAAKQRGFLKPAGDAPTPGQREVEKNHEDWLFNVKFHARNNPLSLTGITYKSEPLQEQDVVGLFNQLSARGVFPGLQIFATSQSHTYDSLVQFECILGTLGLSYKSADQNPLGISPYILGEKGSFSTKHLTLEFKNNLDKLVEEIGGSPGDSRKDFNNIDICVCWSFVTDKYKGFALEEVTTLNLEERKYPGVTHLLRKDGNPHVVQVILLKTVVEMIEAGRIPL